MVQNAGDDAGLIMATVTAGTSLTGSVTTVVEYLEVAVHSILFQRGIYPSDGNS